MSAHNKALFAIFVAALLWASSGTVGKLLFLQSPPFVAAFHRFLLASIIMLPFFLREKKPKNYLSKLLPLGLFNAGNILCYYAGLALTTANTGSILGAAVPISTAIMSHFLIQEEISKRKSLGIIIGLIGTLFIVFLPLWRNEQIIGNNIIGNLLLIGSLLSWTMYIVYSRSLLSKGGFTPTISTSINIFVVTIATGFSSLLMQEPLFAISTLTPSYWWTLLYASVGITVVTFFLFQWAVQHVSASTASLKDYLQLVAGLIINAVILGEHVTLTDIIGSALVILGVIIATGQNLTRRLALLIFSKNE